MKIISILFVLFISYNSFVKADLSQLGGVVTSLIKLSQDEGLDPNFAAINSALQVVENHLKQYIEEKEKFIQRLHTVYADEKTRLEGAISDMEEKIQANKDKIEQDTIEKNDKTDLRDQKSQRVAHLHEENNKLQVKIDEFEAKVKAGIADREEVIEALKECIALLQGIIRETPAFVQTSQNYMGFASPIFAELKTHKSISFLQQSKSISPLIKAQIQLVLNKELSQSTLLNLITALQALKSKFENEVQDLINNWEESQANLQAEFDANADEIAILDGEIIQLDNRIAELEELIIAENELLSENEDTLIELQNELENKTKVYEEAVIKHNKILKDYEELYTTFKKGEKIILDLQNQ